MKPTVEMVNVAWKALNQGTSFTSRPTSAFVDAITAALSLVPEPVAPPERLRDLSQRATPGQWLWHTSNSWLRLGTDARGYDRNGTPYGQDGYIAYPYVSHYDRHPDLCIRNEDDRALIVEAVNWLREIEGSDP